MSLRLLSDAVAIIPLEDPVYRSESGLWLAEQTRQRVDQGIVKYRGPATVDLRVGDHVFFSAYNGTKMTIEGEGILIVMSESDVDAIWDEPPRLMFPKQVVDRLLDEAKGMSLQICDADSIEHIFQILRSKFDDYEREKGLEF